MFLPGGGGGGGGELAYCTQQIEVTSICHGYSNFGSGPGRGGGGVN